jgi:signal transduction histidine kinase
MTTTMTVAAPADTTAERGGVPILRQLGVDTAYVLVGFPLAVMSFVLLVTGLSLGGGLLVTIIGFPILGLTLLIARGFAEVERWRITPVLRIPRMHPIYKRAPEDAGFWRKVFTPLADGQLWLDLLHGILIFAPAVATFCIVITWWVTAVAGVFYWAYDWALPHGTVNTVGVMVNNRGLPQLLGFPNTAPVRILFNVGIGLLFALSLPWVVRGCALAQAWFGRAMLTGVAQLREQITGLQVREQTAQARTAAAASAEAIALRRLERDIHDGPQQRLVRIAVDLGRAQQQLGSDPEAARRTVDEALTHTREALDELRALSRGIAPPILTDRGLAAALAALAARCTVPVELDVPDVGRGEPLAEQTAYFAAAEALTNVAKHSGATRCVVEVREWNGWLAVRVSDNGYGGAHIAKGHGLAGLTDRLQASGGRLTMTSPLGGPTELIAELPWSTVP